MKTNNAIDSGMIESIMMGIGNMTGAVATICIVVQPGQSCVLVTGKADVGFKTKDAVEALRAAANALEKEDSQTDSDSFAG